MANPHRGEVEITLRGKAYTLRLAHAGIAEAEAVSGIGLVGMFLRVQEKAHGFREIAGLIYGGLIGAGTRELSFPEVQKAVLEEGLSSFHIPALVLLSAAMSGIGTEDVGKKEEPKATPAAT